MTAWDGLPRSARRRAGVPAGDEASARRPDAAPGDRRPPITAATDTGCRVAPSCLHCPFAICIYEDPRGPRAATHAGRDLQVWRDYRAGRTARSLAHQHGLSRRQVFRILRRVRAEQAEPARQLPLPLED